MRDDFHTSTVDAAAAWEANHTPDPIPPHDGLNETDIPTSTPHHNPNHCTPDCWACALPNIRTRLANQLGGTQ